VISGLVMLCLAVGCWPRGFQGEDRQALAALILCVSQSSTGALRIKMLNKLAALVALGKRLGMFDERPQNTLFTWLGRSRRSAAVHRIYTRRLAPRV